MKMRRFEVSDVPQLTQLLHRAYAELGALGLNFTAVDQNDETTLRRATGGATWVIEEGGRLMATMTVSWPPEQQIQELTSEASIENRAWLNQLAVDPSRRGEGLARRLRDSGFEWCRDRGALSIGLDTAKPAKHLVDLYGSWGFDHVGEVQWPGKTYSSVIMTRMLV